MTWTQDQIRDLKAGDKIQWSLTGLDWSEPVTVVSIHARDVDVNGKAFVCGYHNVVEGSSSCWSFSAKEGEGRFNRLAESVNAPAAIA